MRITHLFLTCCLLISGPTCLSLVSAQDETASSTEAAGASVSSIISKIRDPSDVMTGGSFKHDKHHDDKHDDGNKIKINNEVEIDAKDIIVNVGKVDIGIEVENQKSSSSLSSSLSSAISSFISKIRAGFSSIGSRLFHNDHHDNNNIKINKEIEMEAKDVIVNVGKVDIDFEIEKKKQKKHSDGAAAEFASDESQVSGKNDHPIKRHDDKHDDGTKIKIIKEIEIEAKDIIVNIGKVKVDVDVDKHDGHSTKEPTGKPTGTREPTKKPTKKPTKEPTGKPTKKPTWKPSNFQKKMNKILGDAYPSQPQLLD